MKKAGAALAVLLLLRALVADAQDTSGPSMNILIKLVSMLALLIAPVIA